jgi:hypothetical protein
VRGLRKTADGRERCRPKKGAAENASVPSRLSHRPTHCNAAAPKLPTTRFHDLFRAHEKYPRGPSCQPSRTCRTRRNLARRRALPLGRRPPGPGDRAHRVGATGPGPGDAGVASGLHAACHFVRRHRFQWRGFDVGVGNTATAAHGCTRPQQPGRPRTWVEHRCLDWEESGPDCREAAQFCIDAPRTAQARRAAPGLLGAAFRGRRAGSAGTHGASRSITVTPSGASKVNKAGSGVVFICTFPKATVVWFPKRSVTVLAATRPLSDSTSRARRS